MEPVAIASATVALLTPFVTKAFEAFAGEGGKRAWAIAERVLTRIRHAERDRTLADAASSFERDPAGRSEEFKSAVEEALRADDELRRELTEAIEQVGELRPELRIVQQVEAAKNVTGLRARRVGMSRGITVHQEVGQAEHVIGAELGELD